MNCSHLFLFCKYYVANHLLHIFNIPKQTIQTNHELLVSIFILKVLRGKPPVTYSKQSNSNHSNHSNQSWTARIYFYFASIMWQTTCYIFLNSKTYHSNHSQTDRIYFYFESITWQTTCYIFLTFQNKPFKPFTNWSHLFLFCKYYVANHPLHFLNIPKQTKHELLVSIFILKVLCGKPPVTYF
jgi:hypothetical protein